VSHEETTDTPLVERLLREHLERRIEQTDTAGLVARLHDARASQSQPPVTHREPVSGRWVRAGLWIATTASAVCLAFLSGRSFAPAVADAETILRDVRSTHSRTIDRCYQVQFAPAPGYWNGKNPLNGPSETVLWTRGDRFWADAKLGTIQLVYGRDEQGSLWVSPSRSKGIRLSEGDEPLPDEIEMYCAINSLTVPALVDDVLVDFDLRTDPPNEPSRQAEGDVSASGNTLVWAQLKPGRTHARITSALLEIDQDSTLVRLILWTIEDGQPRGTVTFTLVESGHQGDEQYQLQSHLDESAEIRFHRLTPVSEADPSDESPAPKQD
jgi:hypothetical protein